MYVAHLYSPSTGRKKHSQPGLQEIPSNLEAAGMAQWTKHFLCKHEDLSADSQHPYKKLGMVVCAYNPREGEWQGQKNPGGLASQLA